MTRRLTKDELDEQFELFLKESVSDDSVDLGNLEKPTGPKDKSQKPAQKPTVSWWEEDDDKVGSGRSFLKSLRKSQTIREEEESTEQKQEIAPKVDTSDTHDVLLTPALESLLGVDSLGEAAMLGVDTLEEAEEKERFFDELEAGASSTIDYSKLNKDLDSTTSTERPGQGKTEEVLEEADKENPRESPGSPHYSDDFEEEVNVKEPEQEQKPKMSPILAKVSLYDSLDDTREEERKKLASASQDKALSCAQSGGSDLEALHEALQIHMVQDSEELIRTLSSSPKPAQPQTPSPPPSSPPHHRPASTIESDLPTAEELMKTIRPEQESLNLQPLSVSDQTKAPESQDLQGTFSVFPHRKTIDFEGDNKPLSGWTTTTDPLPAADPPLIQDRTWNIREELQRLMHENESPPPPAQTKTMKKQTSGSSGSSQPYLRRTTVTAIRGRTVDSKTTVTSQPTSVHTPSAAQTKSKTTKLSESQPRGTRILKKTEKTQSSSERGVESSDLVASVQSLVSVLQQQINTKHSEPATTQKQTLPLSPTRQKDEWAVMDDLKAQLSEKENLIKKLRQDLEELNSVKRHNYVLQSQLHSAEEAAQKNKWINGTDSKHQEKLQQMDKEMKEQEMLIKGYQQENERLYQQMKTQQARSKANEDAMFKENQRLLSELAFTREQLNKVQRPVSNLCSMDHSQRITQLLDQINGFQKREERQHEEIQQLKQKKQNLEVDLQLLREQRDRAGEHIREQDWIKNQEQNHTKDKTPDQVQDLATSDSGDRAHVLHVMEQRHKEEVSQLNKKLKWFAENQELLDRDAARLRAATEEILQLKEQVEKLTVAMSKRSSEQQRRRREKSADAKRTRELERQVKELEQVLRNRNPNSLPALILAAASAPDTSHGGEGVSHPSAPAHVTALLESRVQRLEAELEAHDEQSKRTLRAMEQQFQAVRMRFEQQISELEQQLEQKPQMEKGSDLVLVQSLREELRRERDAHKLKQTALEKQLDSVQQQLKLKSHSSPGRHQRQAEAAFGLRIERLNQELSTKSRTIQDLTRTVDRLQREKRSMPSVPVPKAEGRATEAKKNTTSNKSALVSQGQDTEMFPALSACDKTYQPTVFTDPHISEVLQENETLRQKLGQIQSDSEREREELQTVLTQTQEKLRRLQEEHSQQLSSVQTQSLRDQAQLKSAFALEHSESAVAQLTSQVNTQQILVQHFQEQLTEAQGWREALNVSRAREDALEKQLIRLLEDLKEAQDKQSPEVKLLRSLERKLQTMETKHQLRDQELQQVIGGGFLGTDLQSEVQRWKRAAQEKTQELDCFRLELDSILDIIRHLQKQGVVLPAPCPQITAPPNR